jgi:hypothetical protein
VKGSGRARVVEPIVVPAIPLDKKEPGPRRQGPRGPVCAARWWRPRGAPGPQWSNDPSRADRCAPDLAVGIVLTTYQRRKCGVHSGYRVQDQSHR